MEPDIHYSSGTRILHKSSKDKGVPRQAEVAQGVPVG